MKPQAWHPFCLQCALDGLEKVPEDNAIMTICIRHAEEAIKAIETMREARR